MGSCEASNVSNTSLNLDQSRCQLFNTFLGHLRALGTDLQQLCWLQQQRKQHIAEHRDHEQQLWFRLLLLLGQVMT
jgi:hypothetical protein